jgi:hypothetical protein
MKTPCAKAIANNKPSLFCTWAGSVMQNHIYHYQIIIKQTCSCHSYFCNDTTNPISAMKPVIPANACVAISTMLPIAAISKAAANVVYTLVRCCRTTGVLKRTKGKNKNHEYSHTTYKEEVLPKASQSIVLVNIWFMLYSQT